MLITNTNHVGEVQRVTMMALPAAIMTTLIILTMLSLIATDYPQIAEGGKAIATVVMPPLKPIPVIKKPPLTKPVDPLETPKWIPPEVTVEFDKDATGIRQSGNEFEPIDDEIEYNSGGGIVAYLKVAPMYPSRPLSRGIEGFVDLSFDITPAGSTTNIRVIAADPQGVFEKSAITALKKWKYKVPVEDGIATGQQDMMTRISFTIDE